MHWRVTLEAIDPTGDDYRREFTVAKTLDGLTEGKIGCGLEDGKSIMAQIQQVIVEREVDLWVEYRRACPTCHGRLPIKDYRNRTLLTVYGPVSLRAPRLTVCQTCHPGLGFTFSPIADLCPDRATPELLELSAKLGALFSYREASGVLATFLPGQSTKRFTTLRNRTLAIGERIETAERDQYWYETLGDPARSQLELDMPGDPAAEFVFNVDTAHIPLVRHDFGRTFEAVVGHCGRGGRGDTPGPIFAFEGTRPKELKAVAALALKRQGYQDRGAITVISDGEECLKRLSSMLPQPTTHILDWFHIAMKIQPLAQMAATAPEAFVSFGDKVERIKWRLWNGQAGRALSLMREIRADFREQDNTSFWGKRVDKQLRTLETYIRRNQGSVVNYGARHRSGARIATSPAEATVNRLVAKRFVKKQQMRWSRSGAHYLLKVRAAVLNGNLSDCTRYNPPQFSANGKPAAFVSPKLPLFEHQQAA